VAPSAPASATSRNAKGRPAGLFTWLAVGVVVVVVAALVIVKVAGGGPGGGSDPFVAAPSTISAQLQSVPTAVFNSVGTTSSASSITPPYQLKNQPLLTETVAGKKLPLVIYVGAEYCPFCAAQRWATIVALSRFGTFSNLGLTHSSSVDVYANTPSFTFRNAVYSSKYLALQTVETNTNVYNGSTTGTPYSTLQTMTPAQQAIFQKYDTSNYLPISASNDYSIPFITMGNQFLVSGASYSPALLSGQTQAQIAATLSSTASPIADAIIASANYQTAALCTLTHNQPSTVCTSAGVLTAKKAMKL
jgi:hypothetical protein